MKRMKRKEKGRKKQEKEVLDVSSGKIYQHYHHGANFIVLFFALVLLCSTFCSLRRYSYNIFSSFGLYSKQLIIRSKMVNLLFLCIEIVSILSRFSRKRNKSVPEKSSSKDSSPAKLHSNIRYNNDF